MSEAAYLKFLHSKIEIAPETGFEVDDSEIHPALKRHQRPAVQWAVKGGRRALFESFGLGKSIQQLEILRLIQKREGGRSLIVCPLGVKQEFAHDAVELLGMPPPRYVRTMAEANAADTPIVITNYERVRDGDIDPTKFCGTSLDEASVLRSYGSKTYQEFLRLFKGVPYKFVCTATPSPNRYKELIHYAGYLDVMDTGQALAQPLDAKVLTPTGWRLMGDIQPGDEVIAGDGTVTHVVGVYPQGEKPILRVTFDDGAQTECTPEHLWLTATQYERNNEARYRKRNGDDAPRCGNFATVKTAEDIATTLLCESTGSKNHLIPMVGPVAFRAKDVAIDPWLLGYLLGNGALRETSVGVTTADEWAVSEMGRRLPEGLTLRKKPQAVYDYTITTTGKQGGMGPGSNPILGALRGYDLLGKRAWEKSVPAAFLFNSQDVRVAVLQGLLDSDGTVAADGTQVRFVSTSRELSGNVVFLAQSLGGTANLYEREGRTPKGEVGRVQYVVTVRLPNGFAPFLLPRKAARVKDRTKYPPKRYVVSVEPVGTKPAQCIAVAHPDRLYVTDDFVVTHNTRFFQRDSTQANNLTLYPHKETEFWLWVSTWALFVTKPSDVGPFSDEGYDLPPLEVNWHEVTVDHTSAGFDRDGQGKLFRDAAVGLKEGAREKRESIDLRVAKAAELVAEDPDAHFLLWHDLEAERHAITNAIPGTVEIYGSQDLELREQRTIDFAEGRTRLFATKKELSGSGCNFQRHCHRAVFVGIDYQFNDFIQAIHRIYRFLQTEQVRIDIIHTESEREIKAALLTKWEQHEHMVARMLDVIRKYGLSTTSLVEKLRRNIGVQRQEAKGRNWTSVHNDCVLEAMSMPDNSVDLIHTSIPFANHYEYTPSYNDFGHTSGNGHFWAQMDFLTPELFRVLKPGRIAAIHVKDRILFGNATGDGCPTQDSFHEETSFHFQRHGFRKLGMITVVTDVVRENNQTYRLGWTECCKDGSKMGVGCPEYILLFRKLPSDTSKAYADTPVAKSKAEYTRAQWQLDAHGFWRSSGNRLLSTEELAQTPVDRLQAVFRDASRGTVYDYAEHVRLAKVIDDTGHLPSTFMVVAPGSPSPDVWDDVNRMKTLNTSQSQRRQALHVCPLQLDIVERIINRFSNLGDLVFDPFGGLMTVPYQAVKMGRRGYGCELNGDYWGDGVGYLQGLERKMLAPTLFDLMAPADEPARASAAG